MLLGRQSWLEASFTLLAKPSQTNSAWKTNLRYEMEAFTPHAEPDRTEPDRVCSQADVCFYSPVDDRFCCAIGLTSWGWSPRFLFTMRATRPTLDCKVLINAVHLRPTLWEQSYKTYQNRDLKLKLREKWLLNVTCLVSKNIIFWYIDCNSVMSCVEGIIQK